MTKGLAFLLGFLPYFFPSLPQLVPNELTAFGF